MYTYYICIYVQYIHSYILNIDTYVHTHTHMYIYIYIHSYVNVQRSIRVLYVSCLCLHMDRGDSPVLADCPTQGTKKSSAWEGWS